MQDKDIVFVSDNGGDWEGLYINGVLQDESHSLPVWRVLEILGIEYKRIYANVEDRFPFKLEEITIPL